MQQVLTIPNTLNIQVQNIQLYLQERKTITINQKQKAHNNQKTKNNSLSITEKEEENLPLLHQSSST